VLELSFIGVQDLADYLESAISLRFN